MLICALLTLKLEKHIGVNLSKQNMLLKNKQGDVEVTTIAFKFVVTHFFNRKWM